MWIVLLQQPGLHAYGPFATVEEAEEFRAFLAAEVDPAAVLKLASPVRELLGWREQVKGARDGRRP